MIGNSIIFASTACRSCEEGALSNRVRLVLRTCKDICATCGTVLSSFAPGLRNSDSAGPYVIPAAVSLILEQLLTNGLFSLDGAVEYGRMQGADGACCIGDQATISLVGQGNCRAKLRWHYSRLAQLAAGVNELGRKPGVQKASEYRHSAALPSRIARSMDALSDFFTTGVEVSETRTLRSLIFQRCCELQEQPLETTTDLCLVIAVELLWLKLGSTFPDESGPRIYSVRRRGPAGYLEEVLDLAIFNAMRTGRKDEPQAIYRLGTVSPSSVAANVFDPLFAHKRSQSCASASQQPQGSTLVSRGYEPRYIGPYVKGGRYLVPEGLAYQVQIEVPNVPSLRGTCSYPSIKAKIAYGDFSTEIDVPGTKSFSDNDFPASVSYLSDCVRFALKLPADLPTIVGQEISVAVTAAGVTEEKTFALVSFAEYEAMWDLWRNQIIDQYKTKLLAEFHASEDVRTRAPNGFKGGENVASFIAGRWTEGGCTGLTATNVHKVTMIDDVGRSEWEFSRVRLLM